MKLLFCRERERERVNSTYFTGCILTFQKVYIFPVLFSVCTSRLASENRHTLDPSIVAVTNWKMKNIFMSFKIMIITWQLNIPSHLTSHTPLSSSATSLSTRARLSTVEGGVPCGPSINVLIYSPVPPTTIGTCPFLITS